MSKSCPTCGAVLEDNASFCTTCGAQFQTAEPAPQKAAPDKKKLIMMIGAGVVGLILIIILCSLLFGSPYKSAIENAYSVQYGDFENFESLVPPEVWEYREEKYKSDMDDYLDSAEKSYRDSKYDDRYGDEVTVSIEVTKEIDMPKGMVEKAAEYLDKTYDIDEESVSAIKKVYYNRTIKSDVYANYVMETYDYVIQINGKWYMIDTPDYNSSDDVWSIDFVY